MAVEYVNRQGRVCYLLQGTTKTGKPQFYFAVKPKGRLADEVPEGYEIYEEPEDAQVFPRKRQPRMITGLEQALLEECIRKQTKVACFIVDARKRLFSVERWCFRGSIDNWIPLDDGGALRAVAEEYVPHLGQASFFELCWGGRFVR